MCYKVYQRNRLDNHVVCLGLFNSYEAAERFVAREKRIAEAHKHNEFTYEILISI